MITPYICAKNAAAAIEFYKQAFGAVETTRMPDEAGVIRHAELTAGDNLLMLSDESPQSGVLSPQTLGGSSTMLMIRVPDCDAAFQRSIQIGATELRAPDDRYGERSAIIRDPFGHRWGLVSSLGGTK